MAENNKTLSPAECKSISDYLMELSEKMEKATRSTEQISAPHGNVKGATDHPTD